MKKRKEMKETKMKTSMLISNLIEFYFTLNDLVRTTRLRLITRTRRTRREHDEKKRERERERERRQEQNHVIDERTTEIAEMSSEMTFILQF